MYVCMCVCVYVCMCVCVCVCRCFSHRARYTANSPIMEVLMRYTDAPPAHIAPPVKFKVGQSVVLSANYKDEGMDMYGPLENADNVGKVVEVTKGKDPKVHVKYGDKTWGYSPRSLVLFDAATMHKQQQAKLLASELAQGAAGAVALRRALPRETAPVREDTRGASMSRLALGRQKSLKANKFLGTDGAKAKDKAAEGDGFNALRKAKTSMPAVVYTPPKRESAQPPGRSMSAPAEPAGKRQWEFDRANLFQGEKLGEGNFGQVYRGTAKGALLPGMDVCVFLCTLVCTQRAETAAACKGEDRAGV